MTLKSIHILAYYVMNNSDVFPSVHVNFANKALENISYTSKVSWTIIYETLLHCSTCHIL